MARSTKSKLPADASPVDGDSAVGTPDDVQRHLPFPVVGVGASAGGLEALTELLRAVPTDTGMAFVLIPHLSPERHSMMAGILQRSTALPVIEVEDEPAVEPNHVYVIPPGRDMVIEGGRLRLVAQAPHRAPLRSIDRFLHSLAHDRAYSAIAVILSGSGSDGATGVQEVKSLGGITFAQDRTAQHGAMPQSAVATGAVDFVMAPEGIAAELARVARHPYVATGADIDSSKDLDPSELEQVLEPIRRFTGVDFAHYKRNTLVRRVARRMVLHRVNGLVDYAGILRGDRAEIEALYQDILINVTSFFRNAEAFDAIESGALPPLFAKRAAHETVRIWVMGCSTGEEAYSLAILASELAAETGRRVPIQIFATDLNGRSIDKARLGVYPRTIADDISPERLRSYFVEMEGGYRVAKQIRDLCIFARHNGLTDPPFSRVDLISCRNLLIYLDQTLQQQLIPTFHYALNPQGFLWLGRSESIGEYTRYFSVADSKHRIYSKRPGPALPHRIPLRRPVVGAVSRIAPVAGAAAVPFDEFRESDRILVNRYTPPSVLINGDFDVLQYRGDLGRYLTPHPGKATLNLLKMLRDGLLPAVRSAVSRARKAGRRSARIEGLQIKSPGGTVDVDIEVIAIAAGGGHEESFLVVFEDPSRWRIDGQAVASRAPAGERTRAGQAARMRQELLETREYLQSVIEQQETANDRMQAANEEVESANEELQTINEELETSKEELESANEELATVNDELQHRNAELNRSNDDFRNLLSSVQMAIVMLGSDLRIRRFTPAAERLLNLIATDAGRPITDIKLNVDLPDLGAMLTGVIESLAPRELETQDSQGHWYLVRMRPYQTVDSNVEGAVLILVDIDGLKRAEAALRESEARFKTLADDSSVLIWMQDAAGHRFANHAYLEFLGVTAAEVQGADWHDFLHPDDRAGYLRALDQAMARRESLQAQARVRRFDGEYRWMKHVARPRVDESDRVTGHVGSAIDIQDLKQAEESLRRADRNKNQFLAMLGHELRNPLAPLRNAVDLLRAPALERTTLAWVRDMLDRQTRAISRMVDDLLDISRITEGRIHLQRDTVDIRTVLEHAVGVVQDRLAERHQSVSLDLTPMPVLVDGDPVRLEQLFGNLVHNASKFSPVGGRIWVTMLVSRDHTTGEEPGLVEVRVRDEGSGIAPEVLPRIFEPFMQVERSLDRATGGLGLGLTLARNLTEMHGGRLTAYSGGLGRGAEFVVQLPITAHERTPEGVDAAAPRVDRPRRVLIADDNVDASDALARLLRKAGHEVEVVHRGDEVIAVACRMHPDAVLLDLGLPGRDGYQVARDLRALPETANVLLLAVTGYGGAQEREQTRLAGFDFHYTKPLEFNVLAEALCGDPIR